MTDDGTVFGPVSNDGEFTHDLGKPYVAHVGITGTAGLLMHRWSCEDVAAKAAASKGSAAKKTDNVESYVWRCPDGTLGIPGEYLRMSIVNAARYRQDPRSPRKMAMDLFKAGVVALTDIASLGAVVWDALDQRRVTVQRSGVTRQRPMMHPGWTLDIDLLVNTPEYIPPLLLQEVISDAGRLVGIADFRPTYGRFVVSRFTVDADGA